MRDPGILDPRHFFFPRHFYTIYAIFTRFLRDFCDFYAILSNFYAIFAICMRFLRDFCDFYAIFCQAQNVWSQAPKTIIQAWQQEWWCLHNCSRSDLSSCQMTPDFLKPPGNCHESAEWCHECCPLVGWGPMAQPLRPGWFPHGLRTVSWPASHEGLQSGKITDMVSICFQCLCKALKSLVGPCRTL